MCVCMILRRNEAWISNTIEWEYSSNLSLMPISSYVVHSTKDIPKYTWLKKILQLQNYFKNSQIKVGNQSFS